jgi:histidine triad (HIT) family protein
METSCIFCKIAGGQLPAHVLYEDELFIAVLDAFPTTRGHTLIIPKTHTENIYTLPEATAAALLPLAQKLAKKIHAALHPDGINILQNNGKAAGQSVFHYHMHLIPRWEGDGALRQSMPLTCTADELAKLAALINFG